jgi:hypothetical protein
MCITMVSRYVPCNLADNITRYTVVCANSDVSRTDVLAVLGCSVAVVGNQLPTYTTQHLRSAKTFTTLQWKPEISQSIQDWFVNQKAY